MLTLQDKAHIIKLHQRDMNDSGSSEVQIALLTARIEDLQKHFSKHKQDFHSRRGLIQLVNQRRKLLKYLKNNNIIKYQQIANKLSIK